MARNRDKAVRLNIAPDERPESLMTDSNHALALLFLSLSIFLAYSNSLNGTWALDDSVIGRNPDIQKSLDLKLGYRKIAYLSFLLNRWINPFSVFNYRAFNIVIHIINTGLLYLISLVTLNLPGMKERFGRYGFPVAFVTAAVFGLHPININSVAYVVQRMTSLSAFFVMLSLLCYVRGRTASGIGVSLVFFAGSALLVFLGVFSKENGVMALPLFFVYDYFFISGSGSKGLLRKAAVGLAAGLAVFILSAYYLNFAGAAGDLLKVFMNINSRIPALGWTANDVYWTPLQHILTEFRVLGRYLFLLFLPLPGFLVFDRWGMPVSTGLAEPITTFVALLIVTALLVFAVLKSRRMPFVSFGIIWYLTAISLESFIGVGSDLYFEHRNYLPAAGLFLGLSAQAAALFGNVVLRRRIVWTVVVISALLLGGATFARNLVWKDSVTLWTDTLDKEPRNLRAMVALGNSYMKAADLLSAAKYYEKALSMSYPDRRVGYFHDAAYSLGMVSLFIGDLPQAKKVMDLMDRVLDDTHTISILKGYYSSLIGDTEGAVRQLNSVLPRTSGADAVTVYTLLGDTYRRAGDADSAIDSYNRAVSLDPSFSAAYYGMGDAYFLKKDVSNAEKSISRTLSLDPSNPLALALMSDIMLVKKEPVEKAKAYADRAVSSSPVFYQPYASLATVFVMMDLDSEAEAYFRKAEERGLRGYRLPLAKARAYFMKGDKSKAESYLRDVATTEDAPAGLKKMLRSGR